MDHKIIGMTRRGFIVRLGAGALMAAGGMNLAACEQLIVTSKIAGNQLEFLTPPDEETWFYQSGQGTSKEDAPDLNRDNWSAAITVDGGTGATLDFSAIEALSAAEIDFWKTMRCVIIPVSVGTPQTIFVANGLFSGVPLKDVLESLVTIPADIQRIRFTAADGFTTNIPLERVMNPTADQLPIMLAYRQDGESLRRLRGAPVRVIMPETWGYKNIKWISNIDLVTSDEAFGRYETVLYAPDSVGQDAHEHIDRSGKMPLMTLVTQPATNSETNEISGPDITISGVAFSGDARITKIEVSVDGGDYAEIEIPDQEAAFANLSADDLMRDAGTVQAQAGAYPYPGIWVTWSHVVEGLSPGVHRVRFRSTDDRGMTQPDTIPPADIATRVGTVLPAVEVTFRVI